MPSKTFLFFIGSAWVALLVLALVTTGAKPAKTSLPCAKASPAQYMHGGAVAKDCVEKRPR